MKPGFRVRVVSLSLLFFGHLSLVRFARAAPDDIVKPSDAVTLPSGMTTKVMKVGSGDRRPTDRDYIRLHVTVWNGNSGALIEDWQDPQLQWGWPALRSREPTYYEAITLMVVGEVRRCWIPSRLNYIRGINLVVEFELLAIVPVDDPGSPASQERNSESDAAAASTSSASKGASTVNGAASSASTRASGVKLPPPAVLARMPLVKRPSAALGRASSFQTTPLPASI